VLEGDNPGGGAFALFLRPHPGAFRQLMCPHPGEFAHSFKKMLMALTDTLDVECFTADDVRYKDIL